MIRCSWRPVSQELQPEGGNECPESSNPPSESRFGHVLTAFLLDRVALPLAVPRAPAERPNTRSRSPTRAEKEGAHSVLLADSRGVHAQRLRLLRIAPFHWYSSIPLHFPSKEFPLHVILQIHFLPRSGPSDVSSFLLFALCLFFSSASTQPFHWTYEAEQRSFSPLCQGAFAYWPLRYGRPRLAVCLVRRNRSPPPGSSILSLPCARCAVAS